MFKFLEDKGRIDPNITLHSSYRNLRLELRADQVIS